MIKLKLGNNHKLKTHFIKIFLSQKKIKHPYNYGHKIGIYNKHIKISILKISNLLLTCKMGAIFTKNLNKLILNLLYV